jgi:tetrahydromethanopterin S-methyltransferase subunit G
MKVNKDNFNNLNKRLDILSSLIEDEVLNYFKWLEDNIDDLKSKMDQLLNLR